MEYYTEDPNWFMDYPFPPPPPPPLPQQQHLVVDPNWNNNKSSGSEVAPNCPRCASSNTKFCYYNNYSFSQPRYFCKSCRRYWTKGGSLRSVPVGGGCRKTRRSRAARPSPYQRPGSVSSDSDQTSNSDPEPSAGSDIDLAAVFANYLNPISNPNPHQTCSAEAGTTDAGIGSATVSEELGDPNPTFSDQNVEFVGDDSGSYGLDSVINEDFIMWPDEMNLGGLDWQPMVDLVEECGSFSSEEISEVLIDDNWSSFDLSSCL